MLRSFRIVLAIIVAASVLFLSSVPVLSADTSSFSGQERILSLKEAFHMGLDNSRQINSARYQPLQAEEEYQKNRAIYDPSIFITGTADRTDRPTESELDGVTTQGAFIQDEWQIQAGVKNRLPTGGSLSLYQQGSRLESTSTFVTPNPQYKSQIVAMLNQPLLKGLGDPEGQTSIRVSDLNRKISDSALVRDVNDILLDIASNYWQLYYEQSVVRVNRESYERASDVYQRENSRSEQGLSKSVDVDRAMSAMKTRSSNLLRSENQARAIMRQLWLQLNPEEMFVPGNVPELKIGDQPSQEFDSWVRAEILSHALNHREDVSIAMDTVEISQQQLSLADHNQLPNLDLKISYGFNGLDGDQDGLAKDPYDTEYNDWSVQLAFEWPIGGRSASAEKRKADYRLMQSREDMRLIAERVALEVDIVLDQLRLAKEELDATRQAMDAAKRVMDGEEIMFELGQKDNQDLLTIQDYYGSAQKDYYRALSRFNINLVSLARARGSLLSDYQLPREMVISVRNDQASP